MARAAEWLQHCMATFWTLAERLVLLTHMYGATFGSFLRSLFMSISMQIWC